MSAVSSPEARLRRGVRAGCRIWRTPSASVCFHQLAPPEPRKRGPERPFRLMRIPGPDNRAQKGRPR